MMTRRIIFVSLAMTVALSIILARAGHSVEICKVISPDRFEKLHTFPVTVVVEFTQEARPDTFRALLNGIDITNKFEEIGNGMRALVGPENGLRIEVEQIPNRRSIY